MSDLSSLVARLRPLKDGGIEFDVAWKLATGGNRRDFFHPTTKDNGVLHPDDMPTRRANGYELDETYARFVFRTVRDAYLDEGRVVRLAAAA